MINDIYDGAEKSQPNPLVPISFFRKKNDNGTNGFYKNVNQQIPWQEFVQYLQSLATMPRQHKESAFLFAPAMFKRRRCVADLIGTGMLVLDADGGVTYAAARDMLWSIGFEAVIYTSANHRNPEKENKEKYRILIPLQFSVNSDYQKKAVRSLKDLVCDWLGVEMGTSEGQWDIDPSKLNPYSLFYVPGQYECAGENLFEHIEGKLLDPESLLENYPQPDLPEYQPKPVDIEFNANAVWNPYEKDCWLAYLGQSSGRYNGLFGLMTSLAMSAIHSLYDVSPTEIAGLAFEAQEKNPPSSKDNLRSWSQLEDQAHKAVNEARCRVSEPVAIKQREQQRNRILYGQNEPWKSGTKGVMTLKAMLEDFENELENEPEYEPDFIIVDEMEDETATKKKKKRFYNRKDSQAVLPPDWLIENLIPEDADVGLYGPSGTLKSFVALDLAHSLAMAFKAFGVLQTKEAKPVFYFAGEGFNNLIKKRQTAWEIDRGLEPYSMTNVWLADGAPITNDKASIDADIADMKELLEGRKPGLFVIDTLSRALNGQNEDQSATASVYFSKLKQMRDELGGGTTITIGHFGKDRDRGERGSSNFRASYDAVLWIEEHSKDENTGVHTIQLYVAKQKDADDGRRIWLQSKTVHLPAEDDREDNLTSLVLVPVSEDEGRTILQSPAQKANRAQRENFAEEVENALHVLVPAGGYVNTNNLAKYLADKAAPPNTDEIVCNKLKDAIRGKLKRGRNSSLFKFAINESDWMLPMMETVHEQMQETMDIINGGGR